jgi:hypothetical protein
MPITKSPTNEYVALLTFSDVNDPTALREELMFTLRSFIQVDNGDLESVQVEPIVPHCGHGNN